MRDKHVPVAILGGGIAGLGAAYRAKELGIEAVIYEARPTAGGLLDNFTINGFRFDYAVHLSFATEELVRKIFDKTPYHTHPSDSYCFEKDKWLKHPVQNNLYPLSAEEKISLIKSFLSRASELAGDDYESWLRHQYGDAIAERYPIRYTSKYWDTPASELSTNWIGSRMRRAQLDEILYGAFSAMTPNQYYTKEMRYPKSGGYKAFIQPLIDEANIRLEHQCSKIDLYEKKLYFTNGEVVTYQKLVSSLPLPVLVRIASPVSDEIKASANRLVASSIDLISVGFNKSIIKDLWFYIYDEDIYASRAYSPSVKSPDSAPVNCSSLQFEIYNRGEKSRFEVEDLKSNTLMALQKMKIAQPEDVVVFDHRRIKYGNVIFNKGMEIDRQRVLNWCESEGIASCGRFGRWDYLWSNQSFMSGYGAVN